MAEYVSNSHKSKSPVKADAKKKVERVTNGPVRKKKRSGIQKLADIFILEDVQSVKEIVCQDVLIPSIKKVVVDTAISSIDMLFNGETGRAKRGGSRTSYRDYYDSGVRRDNRRQERVNYQSDSILFNSYGDAEAVLIELEELVSTYGVASVMDLYSAAGIQCDYTCDKYGWTDLRTAQVVRARLEDGYYIRLPKAMPL